MRLFKTGNKETDKLGEELAKELFARPIPDVLTVEIFLLAVPTTHLALDGSEFYSAAAPMLAKALGESFGPPSSPELCVLPDISEPFGPDTYLAVRKQ